MSNPGETIKEIAETGANVSINAGRLKAETTETIVKTVAAAGGHVTVRNADALPPEKIVDLAKIAGPSVTVELG